MVRWYNKPEYWVQLAGVYGQLGEEAKQLAMLEAAYQQGFLVKGTDLLNWHKLISSVIYPINRVEC